MAAVDRDRVKARVTALVHGAARRAPRSELTAQTAGLTAAELEAVVAGLAVWAAVATRAPSIGRPAGATDESLWLADVADMLTRGVWADEVDDGLDRYAA